VLTLFNDRPAARTMGKNGYEYVVKHFDRLTIAASMEKILIDSTNH